MRKTVKPDRPIIYDLVKIDHQEVVTTSRIIAERFEKRHDNVLDAIERIIHGRNSALKNKGADVDLADTSHLGLEGRDLFTPDQRAFADSLRKDFAKNFRKTMYTDDRGKARPMFLLNNDAARMVIMGFTGEKAEVWRFLFVRAFSEMEKELQRLRSNQTDPAWQEQRTLGKIARRSLTDVIADYDEYGVAEGEKSSGMFYTAVTKAIQRSMFKPEDGVFSELRPRLTRVQLNDLATVERAVARRLDSAMLQGKPRKGDGGCYEEIKATIERMVEEIGVSTVPPMEEMPALPGLEKAA